MNLAEFNILSVYALNLAASLLTVFVILTLLTVSALSDLEEENKKKKEKKQIKYKIMMKKK